MKHLLDDMKATFFRWACFVSRRFKFRQICKAIGITPYWWQKDYALSKHPILIISGGRRSGKTMAVMLRALMYEGDWRGSSKEIFRDDPDFIDNLSRQMWYRHEYDRLYAICIHRGIPITYLL